MVSAYEGKRNMPGNTRLLEFFEEGVADDKRLMIKVSKGRAQEIAVGCDCECPGLPMRCPVSCCAYCALYDQCNHVCGTPPRELWFTKRRPNNVALLRGNS